MNKRQIRRYLKLKADVEKEHHPESIFGRVWTFVNSSFGIFIFSSIILTLITNAYANRQADQKEVQEKRTLVRKLETEISYRTGYILHWLKSDKFYYASHAIDTTMIYYMDFPYRASLAHLNNLYGDPATSIENKIDNSTYPEYRSRTFVSLLNELYPYAGDSLDRDIRSTYQAYQMLSDSQVKYINQTSNRATYMLNDKNALSIVEGKMASLRWYAGRIE